MSRQYRPGDTLLKSFTVGATNADATPTVTLMRNGAVDGTVTVTVTNPGAGRYLAACTIPGGYAVGDVVELLVTATIDGAADQAVVDAVRLVGYPQDALPDAAAGETGGVALASAALSSPPAGTANAGGTSTGFTATGEALTATSGAYNGQYLRFESGLLAGERRTILTHTYASGGGGTHTFTFASSKGFSAAPGADNEFVIL